MMTLIINNYEEKGGCADLSLYQRGQEQGNPHRQTMTPAVTSPARRETEDGVDGRGLLVTGDGDAK